MQATSKLLTAGSFFAFFVFGFVDNLKGPLLSRMLRSDEGLTALNYSQAGTVFLAGYVGFMVATLVSGFLASTIGNRRVLQIAGFCLCAGSLGFGLADSFLLWIVSMTLLVLGLGAIELGANALIVQLHSESRGLFLNLLSTFHGLGSFVVPLVVADLLRRGLVWTDIYAWSAILGVPLLVFFRGERLTVATSTHESDRQSMVQSETWIDHLRRMLNLGFTRQMGWFYLLLTAYVALELGLAAWMMEYLQQSHRISVEISARYLSAFFVLLMSGRLVGAFVVQSVGYYRSIAIALVTSTTCVALALSGPSWLIMLLPFSGLAMSIVFPTVTAAVSCIHQQSIGSLLGLLFVFAGLGGALGPWIVGVISQWAGLQTGMASLVAFGAVALLALARIASTAIKHPASYC